MNYESVYDITESHGIKLYVDRSGCEYNARLVMKAPILTLEKCLSCQAREESRV